MTRLAESIAPFGDRRFRLLFASRAISLLGDNIAPIALAFAVLELGGSAGELGLVLAARTLPVVLFVLAGGVWADRLPRSAVMAGADLSRCASQGLTAVLLLAGEAEIWHLAALGAVHGVASALYRPASSGVTPQTVPRALLQEANALLFLALSGANILGPIAGGVLVATVGAGWGIAVDAATFAASALLLLPLRLGRPESSRASFVSELRAGWDEVRSRRWLWVSIVDFAVFQVLVMSAIYVIGPVVADDELGGAAAWASIVSALGAGLVLGGLIALRFRPRRPLAAAFGMVVAVAPALALLGAAVPTAVIVVAMVPAGIALGLAQTLWSTALQHNVPEQMLSRVSSYDWVGSTALRPLGYAAVGPIAAAAGARATLLAAAAGVVVLQLATLSVRELRELPAGDAAEGEPLASAGGVLDAAPAERTRVPA